MIRVLITDDHAIVRTGLAQLLGTTDDLVLVGEAGDGARAIELAAELRPDVVLMDLSMPGVDGVRATASIVADNPDVRILVLTSFSDQTRILDALEAGADGYLLKHSEPEVILAGIREVMTGGSPLDPKAARVLLSQRRATPSADAGAPRRPQRNAPKSVPAAGGGETAPAAGGPPRGRQDKRARADGAESVPEDAAVAQDGAGEVTGLQGDAALEGTDLDVVVTLEGVEDLDAVTWTHSPSM